MPQEQLPLLLCLQGDGAGCCCSAVVLWFEGFEMMSSVVGYPLLWLNRNNAWYVWYVWYDWNVII